MDFSFLTQYRYNCSHQGVFLSLFRISENNDETDEQIVLELLKSKIFKVESNPEIAKDRERRGFYEHGYLKPYYLLPAFKLEKINTNHFKQMDKKRLYDFLDSCLINKHWSSNEINGLKNTVDWLKKYFQDHFSGCFFVLSMDWFDKSDNIINQLEQSIYGYFISIFWVDRLNGLVNSCDLLAD